MNNTSKQNVDFGNSFQEIKYDMSKSSLLSRYIILYLHF